MRPGNPWARGDKSLSLSVSDAEIKQNQILTTVTNITEATDNITGSEIVLDSLQQKKLNHLNSVIHLPQILPLACVLP